MKFTVYRCHRGLGFVGGLKRGISVSYFSLNEAVHGESLSSLLAYAQVGG